MTELIIALDCANPYGLLRFLHTTIRHKWYKIGLQSLFSENYSDLMRWSKFSNINVFLDLKLADTHDTVASFVSKCIDFNIAAISTYTQRATETALKVAEGSRLRIWEIESLTDSDLKLSGTKPYVFIPYGNPDGIVCPAQNIDVIKQNFPNTPVICPGVRLPGEDFNNHIKGCYVSDIKDKADFIVVGRPITQAPDTIVAIKKYQLALDPDK